MHPIRAFQIFAAGQSYWRVLLSTGRVWSQLDMVNDPLRGRRSVDWYLDLVGSGDARRIRELWIHTPKGDAALKITQPGTAYQLNAASLALDMAAGSTGRQKDAQIIGRVDNRETGEGIAYIWDVHMQQLYKDEQASVKHFSGWRPGIADLGTLAFDAMGVCL